MLELADAVARIVGAIQSLPDESVLLSEAANRVSVQPILAPVSLPLFDNSAMDGYALCAADVASASDNSPITLNCTGAVPAGSIFEGAVERGSCVRIFTGSPLPAGADAVVMQEDTRATGDRIEVRDAVKPWENVRLAGQDIKTGAVAVSAGARLSAGRIGLLAALGLERVAVAQRPVVGVLSTGNELIEGGIAASAGEIYESNRAALAPLIRGTGALPRVFPLVRDDADETAAALRRSLEECDAVITTGGVSAGEHDYVKAAFESLGGVLDFWKVNIKPGKPFVFGRLGRKFLFGLPGNPVSAFVTFLLLVRPAILKLQGATELNLPSHPAVLAEAFHNRGDRRHFIRVTVDSEGRARSAGLQASHALSCLAAANALMEVPPESSFSAGQQVQVLRWEL